MKKILIIDDYQEIRNLYSDILTKNGYEVESVENADEALKKLVTGGYDLIYLDIMMPQKDGIWVLQQLQKQTPKVPNGKIIAMSFVDENSTNELIKQALALGASDFIDKKITLEELVTKTQQLLTS